MSNQSNRWYNIPETPGYYRLVLPDPNSRFYHLTFYNRSKGSNEADSAKHYIKLLRSAVEKLFPNQPEVWNNTPSAWNKHHTGFHDFVTQSKEKYGLFYAGSYQKISKDYLVEDQTLLSEICQKINWGSLHLFKPNSFLNEAIYDFEVSRFFIVMNRKIYWIEFLRRSETGYNMSIWNAANGSLAYMNDNFDLDDLQITLLGTAASEARY